MIGSPSSILRLAVFASLMLVLSDSRNHAGEREDCNELYRPTCCTSLLDRSRHSCGTLFQWSSTSCCQGGPDLDAPLVTDRPDFTEASSTVGRGVAQLEIGYTFTHDDGTTDVRSHSFPEPLLRYGVLEDWLELRLGWNYADGTTNGLDVSGSQDLYLGLKLRLTPQEGILPEMALIPQMTVPTGASAFSANDVLPGANLIYGWEINDFLSTAGSTQFNRAIDNGSGRSYTEWAQSWTVAYSLADDWGGIY